MYRILPVVLLCVAAPAASAADDWAGTAVFPATDKVSLYDAKKEKVLTEWYTGTAKVLTDDGDWIEVRNSNPTPPNRGWVKKSDVVKLADGPAYYTKQLEKTTDKWWAYVNRAAALSEKGDVAGAVKDLTAAIDLNPKNHLGYQHRALLHYNARDNDKAISDCTEAIRLNPKAAPAFDLRGRNLMEKAQYDKAVKDFDEAIRLDPNFAAPYLDRGIMWSWRKDFDKAIRDFDAAARLEPNEPYIFINRANAWVEKDETEKAIKDYTEAIRVDPNIAEAFANRGRVLRRKGEYEKAATDLTEAIRLDPGEPSAYSNLARIRAACPEAKLRDGNKAVELATMACKLTGYKDANYLDVLAVAYAEVGDFEKAIDFQKKALADKAFAKADGPNARERLKMFQKKMPFHEDPPKKK